MPRFLHFPPKKLVSQPLKSGEAAASPVPPPLDISGPQSTTLTIERGHCCCTAPRGHLKLDDNNGSAITTEKTNSTFHTVWPIEGFYVAISNVFMFNAVSLHFL